MKTIPPFASIGLLLLVFSLGSCQKDEPLVQRESGFILAGESGAGISTISFDPAISVSPNGSSTIRDILAVPELDVSIRLSSSYSSQAGVATYSSSGIGTAGIVLEFAWVHFVDSIMVCDQWAADSSFLDRTTFTLDSDFQCIGGDSSFVRIVHHKSPRPRDSGFRFDAQSDWATDANILFISNYRYQETPLGTVQVNEFERYTYAPWKGISGKYLGFRFLTNGVYRYGYLKLTVNGNSISVSGLGVEDPVQ